MGSRAHNPGIVIKLGSAVLAPERDLDPGVVARLAQDIASVNTPARPVTVVSSGAVAAGYRALGLDAPPRDIEQRQAAAAVGQQRLMQAWSDGFARSGAGVAQVLLTSDDLNHRARYLNARHTIGHLHGANIVPIVNENDTVSYEELRFGDNDALAARVAGLLSAGLLILLSRASGLVDASSNAIVPSVDLDEPGAVRAARSHVHDSKSETGTGGMRSKLDAVEIAHSWGIPTVIASGAEPGVVSRIVGGERVGTRFSSAARPAQARKRWIAGQTSPSGTIRIDAGALRALTERGASLLPSGVTGVTGGFRRGDTVRVLHGERTIALGIAAYDAGQVERIKGLATDQITPTLGFTLGDEVIHRDDLALARANQTT